MDIMFDFLWYFQTDNKHFLNYKILSHSLYCSKVTLHGIITTIQNYCYLNRKIIFIYMKNNSYEKELSKSTVLNIIIYLENLKESIKAYSN